MSKEEPLKLVQFKIPANLRKRIYHMAVDLDGDVKSLLTQAFLEFEERHKAKVNSTETSNDE